MAHNRKRFLAHYYYKQLSFWPVVGIMGLRQVGKTTFLQDKAGSLHTFDDDDVRNDAIASAKAFIGKVEKPAILDEAQKVPGVFDAIKSLVDKKRVPGMFTLSGSSSFNAYKDIRESLTGRIGLCHLYPMTYAEACQLDFIPLKKNILQTDLRARIALVDFCGQIEKGGLPVPIFSRDLQMRKQYWRGWMDTTLGRDLYRVYGKGYDSDIAQRILEEIGKALVAGELATVAHISVRSTKALKYLNAMCAVFILKKFTCDAHGVGRDVYCASDSGFAHALMDFKVSSKATLNLARTYILNEIEAGTHYSGGVFKRNYFKSAKGTPVDLVWNGFPLKIIESTNSLGWEIRSLEGAMKKLGSKLGILVAPTDHADIPKKTSGIAVVPWSFWS